jgi:hypothetical protein
MALLLSSVVHAQNLLYERNYRNNKKALVCYFNGRASCGIIRYLEDILSKVES